MAGHRPPKVPKYVEKMTDEQIKESVIDQAKEAFTEGKISLERFEADIDALLHDKTPVDKNGWPIYYDYRILRHVNY